MDTNKKNTDNQGREEIDRHLQAPGEANRDKHINFTALERGEEDPADIDDSKIHLTDDSTLQTREEKDRDNEEGGLSEGKGIVDRNIQ
jgi:hypothetical protein